MTLRIGTAGANPSAAVVAALIRLEAEARTKGGQTLYVRAHDGRPVGLLVLLPDRRQTTPDR